MSYKNFVQLKLAAAATAAQTTLTVMVPSAPFQLPAANGTLTLLDVPAAPTKAEIVGYTTVTNNGDGTATLGGVTRGKEGTTAQAWATNSFLFQSLTAGDYAADLAAKLDATGNAVSATKLQTARTIGGVSFNGTADINLPGVNVAGNQNTSGNAATATKLQTARTINGVAFDGSANITLPNTDGTPAGAVMAFARSTAPAGWLKANGAAVSRTTYSALFAAIGTTFGAGDGSTTFNLPDLRGEFLRGWDDARGVDSGRTFGSWQDSDNKSHTHTAWTGADAHTHTWWGTTSSDGEHTHTLSGNLSSTGTGSNSFQGRQNIAYSATTSAAGAHTHTVSGTTSSASHAHTVTVNSSGGTEARPRNIALLYCIKF